MTTSQLIQLMQELDPGGARTVVGEASLTPSLEHCDKPWPVFFQEPVTDAQTMPDRLILVLD